MFIAVGFIIAKKKITKMIINRTDEQIVIYSYNKYYSAMKRNKQLIHTTMWMDLGHYAT